MGKVVGILVYFFIFVIFFTFCPFIYTFPLEALIFTSPVTMSQAEVDQLKKQVDDLTALIKAANLGTGQTPSAPRYVYIPKKLRKFSGDRSEMEDWVHEAKSLLATMGYTGKDASDFLITHLEGAAKKEI